MATASKSSPKVGPITKLQARVEVLEAEVKAVTNISQVAEERVAALENRLDKAAKVVQSMQATINRLVAHAKKGGAA